MTLGIPGAFPYRMANHKVQILFVPFLTDTQKRLLGFVCVVLKPGRFENECFVVIAGSVGNLPRVHNGYTVRPVGVFTPCDFAFLPMAACGGNPEYRR